MKFKGRIFAPAFGCLKPSSTPLPVVIHFSLFIYFPIKIKGRIFCSYVLGVWSPSSFPLPIVIQSSLLLISPWRLREEFMSLFFEYKRSPPPFCEKQLQTQVSHKNPVGAKNERFKHPWEERKVNEKLTILISTLVCFVVKKELTTLLMAVTTPAGLSALKINKWKANWFLQDGLVFCVSST